MARATGLIQTTLSLLISDAITGTGTLRFAWLAPKIGFSTKMESAWQSAINALQATLMEYALHAIKDMI
jgi:hypothetical protein